MRTWSTAAEVIADADGNNVSTWFLFWVDYSEKLVLLFVKFVCSFSCYGDFMRICFSNWISSSLVNREDKR
jgi:hypothetical protein